MFIWDFKQRVDLSCVKEWHRCGFSVKEFVNIPQQTSTLNNYHKFSYNQGKKSDIKSLLLPGLSLLCQKHSSNEPGYWHYNCKRKTSELFKTSKKLQSLE